MRWLAVLLVSALFAGCADERPGEPPVLDFSLTMEDGSPLRTVENIWTQDLENGGPSFEQVDYANWHTVGERIYFDATDTYDPDGDMESVLVTVEAPYHMSPIGVFCWDAPCDPSTFVNDYVVAGPRAISIHLQDSQMHQVSHYQELDNVIELRYGPFVFESVHESHDATTCAKTEDGLVQVWYDDLWLHAATSIRFWVESGNATIALCDASNGETFTPVDQTAIEFPNGLTEEEYLACGICSIAIAHAPGTVPASTALNPNTVTVRATIEFLNSQHDDGWEWWEDP